MKLLMVCLGVLSLKLGYTTFEEEACSFPKSAASSSLIQCNKEEGTCTRYPIQEFNEYLRDLGKHPLSPPPQSQNILETKVDFFLSLFM